MSRRAVRAARGSAAAAAALILPAACGDGSAGRGAQGDAPRLAFTELGPQQTGIDVVMTCGGTPSREILEVNGGGLGLIDHDGDGDLDLFVAVGATLESPRLGPGCRLYENLGGLRFRDATARCAIDVRGWANGVAVGDYDGDGRDDLYITCFGPDVLLANRGGRFEDATAAAGVADDAWGTGAAFGDLDADGDLDLYVVNYLDFDPGRPPARSRFKGVPVMAGPHGLVPAGDVVYENLGDGTFRDATGAWGFRVAPAYGLGVAIVDLTGDGLQDVFVGNDSMANFLFRNLGGGRFEEVGAYSGLAANADGEEQATMGIAVADVDSNGRPDLFTSNFSDDTNTLQLNLDGTFFDDRTAEYGLGLVSRPFLGWSCGFYDLDHDGDEDLLVVNGHVYPEATMERMNSWYEQVPLLFARRGTRFERVLAAEAGPFLDRPRRDRAAVFGDLDGDGDVDAAVGELNGPVRVLRNDRDGGNWLVVGLSDDREGSRNRRGLGAVVEVTAGGEVRRRWVHSGGYQSSSALAAHFGLPSEAAGVTVEVTWPDGSRSRLEGVATRQHLVVRRGEAPASAS